MNDLASRISTDQVVVVENEDPDVALQPAIVWHLFTRRADVGRPGFYPTRQLPVVPAPSGESSSEEQRED